MELTTTDYFEIGIKRGAKILDASNLERQDFPLFSCVKQEAHKILNTDFELGYTYPGGIPELRKSIAEHESHIEKILFSSEEVVVNGGGCSGTFDNIFRILARDKFKTGKDKVIINTPSYSKIFHSIEYNGLVGQYVTTLRSNNFQPTVEEISSVLDDSVAAIFLTTPGNPACTYLDPSTLKEITGLAKEKDSYLIVDAVFEEAPLNRKEQHIFSVCGEYSKLIKIKGFSKDRPQLNDLRLGWSLTKNGDICKKLIEAAETSDFSNSTLIERMALADVRNRVNTNNPSPNSESLGELELYQRELCDYHVKIENGMNQAMEVYLNHPAVLDVVKPEAGNILFARIAPTRKIKNSNDLYFNFLNNCNVMVTPGHTFKLAKDEIWFRTTMSRSPEEFIKYTIKILDSLKSQ